MVNFSKHPSQWRNCYLTRTPEERVPPPLRPRGWFEAWYYGFHEFLAECMHIALSPGNALGASRCREIPFRESYLIHDSTVRVKTDRNVFVASDMSWMLSSLSSSPGIKKKKKKKTTTTVSLCIRASRSIFVSARRRTESRYRVAAIFMIQ